MSEYSNNPEKASAHRFEARRERQPEAFVQRVATLREAKDIVRSLAGLFVPYTPGEVVKPNEQGQMVEALDTSRTHTLAHDETALRRIVKPEIGPATDAIDTEAARKSVEEARRNSEEAA